jgi:hypothetical protein
MEKLMVQGWPVLLFLVFFALPAWSAPKKLTIDDLKQLLVSLQTARKGDQEVATALKQVQLSEELTAFRTNELTHLSPGSMTAEQIDILQLQSALLPPPPSDLPKDPPPDAAALQALLAKAQTYTSQSLAQLPSLTASRLTMRFQDSVAGVTAFAKGAGMAQETDPTWTQVDQSHIQMVSSFPYPVQLAQGSEVAPAKKGKSKWKTGDPVASEIPPMPLVAAFQEAASNGDIKWLRWEIIEGKKTAVLTFAIDKNKTKNTVDYCCFPETDTTGIGLGNFQSVSEWKPWQTRAGYYGQFFIDPDSGVIVRTIVYERLKPTDFVHSEGVRTDYERTKVQNSLLILPVQRIIQAEVVPNGDSYGSHSAVQHSYILETYNEFRMTN